MIHYITSVSCSFSELTAYAAELEKTYPFESRRVIIAPGNLSPREQLAWTEYSILNKFKRIESNVDMIAVSNYELSILRILHRIREGEMKGADMIVHCLAESLPTRKLRVDNEGEFIDRWPEGFFMERSDELF
jgi:hypothetical protein